jgi:hypothetical protein
VNEDRVVNGVKGRGQIQQAEAGQFLLTDALNEVVVERQKDSFSGVCFDVCRLMSV